MKSYEQMTDEEKRNLWDVAAAYEAAIEEAWHAINLVSQAGLTEQQRLKLNRAEQILRKIQIDNMTIQPQEVI